MQRRLVVDRNFLSRLNISQSNEEDVTVQNLHERVGRAGVINVVRPIPAAAPVKTPPFIDGADSQAASTRPPFCLFSTNSFAGVFGDFSATLKARG